MISLSSQASPLALPIGSFESEVKMGCQVLDTENLDLTIYAATYSDDDPNNLRFERNLNEVQVIASYQKGSQLIHISAKKDGHSQIATDAIFFWNSDWWNSTTVSYSVEAVRYDITCTISDNKSQFDLFE